MEKNKDEPHYPAPLAVEMLRYTGLAISKIFWRIEYHGTENIPNDLPGGLIVSGNHMTYFDPFWIAFAIKRKFRFMAWDKAFEWPIVGPAIRYFGAFPVSIERGGTRRAMVEALRALKDGATLFIFPEGSRGFSDGKLLEFKTGTARIAIEAGVPILPVSIRGANKVWPQDLKYPHPSKVHVYFHPLLEIGKTPDGMDPHEYAEELTEKLKAIIATKLDSNSD